MREYGFLVDLKPSAANPYQLPVGFTHHFAGEIDDDVLDLTCAGCHTGQLNTFKDGQRVAIRIDGGAAMHAFTDMKPGDFLPDLILAMTATYVNPFKFNRFAKNVLGEEHYSEGRKALRSAFYDVLATLQSRAGMMAPNTCTGGELRLHDAIGGSRTRCSATTLHRRIIAKATLWVTHRSGTSGNSTGRTARPSVTAGAECGEGMGVGTTHQLVDSYGRPTPSGERYQTSTLIENLYQIEKALWWLTPPQWPDDLLGKIDCKRAIYGKALFRQYCVKCHGPRLADAARVAVDAPCKTRDTHWIMSVMNAADIGTDPKAADNFANNKLDLTATGLTADETRNLVRPLLEEHLNRQLALLKPGSEEWTRAKSEGEAAITGKLAAIDLRAVPIGFGLNYFGLLIRQQYRKDPRFAATAEYPPGRGADDGYFGEIDMPQAPPVYKARPLAGIWATPPFLHNGSVPNLYQLLLPADKRYSKFLMGTKDFDAKNVGYVLKPLTERGFIFDTSIAGNSNRGHEFRGSGGPVLPPTEPHAFRCEAQSP
jgi:mono/diheme cytochrome c family protein